jgi:DNA mismatch repair protein MutS2
MDTHTLELLEFDRVRLLVAGYAASSLGKRAAERIAPSTDPGWISEQQSLTTEMAEALIAGLSPPFGGLRDIRDAVRRAKVGATLVAEELAETVDVLRSIDSLRIWLDRIGDQFPRLGALKLSVFEFTSVSSAIEGCLDSRGTVLDTASRRLSAIRREIAQADQRIQDTLRAMLRSPELRRILRYPNFTMVGHHYVLPIAREHRGELQGAVHRTSASNETVYVEPVAVADQSAQLSYLRTKEQKEIRRILRWLSAQVGLVAEDLLVSLQTLGQLDLVHARARFSLDFQMSAPDLNDKGRIVLHSARHPLLEQIMREESRPRIESTEPASLSASVGTREAPTVPGEQEPLPRAPALPLRQVVPIDIHLGLNANILVITGPNTGGKTVALKTVGLLSLMAQSGLHIPARPGSQLAYLDNVLADIGDEQSLEQSLSTFSSHIRRISTILRTTTSRSLVLLDEIGAGTDPVEGAALGRAILDELDAIGCLAIVTTHIGDLKTYAFSNPRAENAAVEFDIETLRPLFRVRIGDIGRSNALLIARRLDLPEHLLERANRYLERAQGEQAAEWEIISRLRTEAESARSEALEAQAEAERTREALAQRVADLQTQAEQDARMVEARARLQPGDRVVVPRFGYDRPGRVVKLDPRKQTARVAIGMMQWDVAIDELIPQVFRTPQTASPPAARTKPSANPSVRSIDEFDEP